MDNSDRSFVSSLPADIMMHAEQQCQRLRDLSQLIILADWRLSREGGSLTAELSRWETVNLNEKGQIAWDRGRTEIWLGLRLDLPTSLQGYPLVGMSCRLALTWWAEMAQVFVDRVLVQEGDLFDHSPRILLTSAVTPGTTVDVRLRLVSPGHDIGALMRSKLVFESLAATPEPGLVADELMILLKQAATFHPEKLAEIAETVDRIDYTLLTHNIDLFTQHILDIKHQVKSILAIASKTDATSSHLLPAQEGLGVGSGSKIYLLGHAHLDMAWLWEVSETWTVAERTFDSALNLQQSFPNLTFCHSTPALYEWIEINKPELFDRIVRQIATGTWEVVGGMWIEPDLNLISGESIARQIIYGQRYNRSKFGKYTRVAWLPDTFGFCWQLPQLLLQGKIDYFVTQKFAWNDTTKFPHQLFWWEAPDGSRVLSLMSSEIGEGIDPLKMIDYACNWQTNTQIDESLWLFGVGDHGGGPTRDMLELAERWSHSDVFPNLEFTTAVVYLDKLASREDSRAYPIWRDELYLEFHRGCFTTHADQKRSNRQCEDLLYQAELWSSLACIINNKSYPTEVDLQLETAWKQTLFDQFHDIIPGTAIEPVYITANEAWENVERTTTQIINNALTQISDRIALAPPHSVYEPIVIFNPSNWQRTELISLPVAYEYSEWSVLDSAGKSIPCELSDGNLLFLAADLPSIGYRSFWVTAWLVVGRFRYDESERDLDSFGADKFTLENSFVLVKIDVDTGDIARIWDKLDRREVLQDGIGANHLEAFKDAEQYWDAWNIDPEYASKPLPPSRLKSIEWRERSALRQCVRVVRELVGCDFQQDYILDAHSPILYIKTSVDWQAEHVLVKANFPLNLTADRVTYEIACGAIERTTKPDTPAKKAKWEVPAHRWADLTDNSGEYGVSLLNDCKYGYDAGTDYLRLTLLRSSRWPDPIADRGYHEFTYAIYPHVGNWQTAATVRKGYELNSPLQVVELDRETTVAITEYTLPSASSLLDLSADNLVMMAFKPSADPAQAWVMRCYECHGVAGEIELTGDLGLEIDRSVDLFDEPESASPNLTINPWQIRSFGVK
jgi:alpha-mannosidase